jgi:hypothetical protein
MEKILILLAALWITPAGAACFDGAVCGYYVIVASLPAPNDYFPDEATRIVRENAAACRLPVTNDFSSKFAFRPGYIAFIVGEGAPMSRSIADIALRDAKKCRDAYIKAGNEPGE